MRTVIVSTLCSVLIAGGGFAAAAQNDSAASPAAARKAAELCSACHGPGGNSISPTFPRLAAQQAAYLESQLKAFRSRTRADPEAHEFMWGMAGPLDDKLIEGLAGYYAAQPPVHGTPAQPQTATRGKTLYLQGDASRHIPACASCHGPQAEGMGAIPRLAGQHAAYVVRQLTVIQSALRAAPAMHGIIKELNRDDMNVLAAYLQSL